MKMPKSLIPTQHQQVNIRRPTKIEVITNADTTTLWFNVDGICRVCVYDIKDCELEITTRLAGYVKT